MLLMWGGGEGGGLGVHSGGGNTEGGCFVLEAISLSLEREDEETGERVWTSEARYWRKQCRHTRSLAWFRI
jgi:hypothetical protein